VFEHNWLWISKIRGKRQGRIDGFGMRKKNCMSEIGDDDAIPDNKDRDIDKRSPTINSLVS
jgi:hypothetical protein